MTSFVQHNVCEDSTMLFQVSVVYSLLLLSSILLSEYARMCLIHSSVDGLLYVLPFLANMNIDVGVFTVYTFFSLG